VTEISRPSPDSASIDALDWVDPSDLPLEEVRDVFVTLFKALRAYQLYDPGNPVYKRFVANLRGALERVWDGRDRLQILIEEERFTWLGEEVYRNENRSDSLSFLLYRDGIRDLTFRKGIESEELELLLDALHRARTGRREGDDLVTILWDLDLKFFTYSAVDLAGESIGTLGAGFPTSLNAGFVLQEELGEDPGAAARRPEGEEAESGGGGDPPPAGTVRKEDFNPTLYALDEEEQEYLRVEFRKEMERDLRMDVLRALFDRLEEPERPDRQEEILGVLRTLVPGFLGRGALGPTARVLEELQVLRRTSGLLSPEAQRLAEGLLEDLSAPETVAEIVRALEDRSIAADGAMLQDLFAHLRPAALAPLLKGSEETRSEPIRSVLREAVRGIAEPNVDAVIALLSDSDPVVATGAVRLVGRMGTTEASGALARLLDQGPDEVRAVILEVAGDLPSAALAGAVQRLLRHPERDLRVGAARVLARLRYAPAAIELRKILEGKGFRQADVTEKVALFESYGVLAGESAVEFLSRVLNGRGFLGRRENPEFRAGAALALGKIGAPAAREALESARKEEDPIVRSAVNRALKGEEAGDG